MSEYQPPFHMTDKMIVLIAEISEQVGKITTLQGNPTEIKEVQNAYEAYQMMLQLNSASVKDLLTAHRFMMNGLVTENGRFRSGGVGIFNGETCIP